MQPITLTLVMVFSEMLLPGSKSSAADDIKISFSCVQLEQQQREDYNVTITEWDIVYEIEPENKTYDDMNNLALSINSSLKIKSRKKPPMRLSSILMARSM